jgi:hypothetical protein
MDFFVEFMKLVVRLFVGIGWLIGVGLQSLFLSSLTASPRLPKPTKAQKTPFLLDP